MKATTLIFSLIGLLFVSASVINAQSDREECGPGYTCDPGLTCVNNVVCSSGDVESFCSSHSDCQDGLFCHPKRRVCGTDYAGDPEPPPVGRDVATEVTCRGDTGINTALGCIPYDPVGLTKFFLGWALGIGGGIALLMIGFAGITIMTSAGDPKKMQGGQQLMTAAISGLLLIIFSTFILRFFGVTLFGIF